MSSGKTMVAAGKSAWARIKKIQQFRQLDVAIGQAARAPSADEVRGPRTVNFLHCFASAAGKSGGPSAYMVFIYSMIAQRSASERSVPYSWPPFPLPLVLARSATKTAFLDRECSES